MQQGSAVVMAASQHQLGGGLAASPKVGSNAPIRDRRDHPAGKMLRASRPSPSFGVPCDWVDTRFAFGEGLSLPLARMPQESCPPETARGIDRSIGVRYAQKWWRRLTKEALQIGCIRKATET